jgi:predicted metalloprotease with PDZ domain
VRPYDLWQPEFSTPQQGSLLWVYEGLTEYWGVVLAARSGFASPDTSKDFLAETTAHLTNEAGRSWRNLLDCTNDNAAPVRSRGPWNSYRRWQDFYYEGVLTWLEADQIIRTASNGRKSLDDFAKVFFPLQDSDARTRTYHLRDVIDALQKVQPYDWKSFFRYHLTALRPDITSGLERSGYKLIYTETPNALMRAEDVGGMAYSRGQRRDLNYSIGATVGASGDVEDVIWGGPAFHAGLTAGSTIDSVAGRPFTLQGLVDAIRSPKGASAPILLGTSALGFQHQLAIKWAGGLRYPHLERNGQPPLLDAILAPH